SAGILNADGSYTLTRAQLAGLTLTPPANWSGTFTLAVMAIALDSGAMAWSSASLPVTVGGVADQPTLSVAPATGVEDAAIPLSISAALTDTDGSETLSITIGNLPAGATLSAGTLNPDGSYTLTAAQLAGLALIPGASWAGSVNLTVTATAAENGT